MAKSMAASLTAAVRRGYDAARRCDGYGSHAYCDPRDHTASALEALYNRAVRYRVGVGGVEFLTGGAPTADIMEYADGSMAFKPTVGWGKDGLAYSIRSALDREHACRAAGWDSTPDADEEAALSTGCLRASGRDITDVGLNPQHGHQQRSTVRKGAGLTGAGQEGSQGGWRLKQAAGSAGRPAGAQNVGVVDAVVAGQGGGHQRHQFVAGVGPAKGIAHVEVQLGQGQVQGPAGRWPPAC